MPLTTVQLGMQGTPQFYGFKNRIINGGMVINQRGTVNTPVTPANTQYTLDRFNSNLTQSGKYSIQQSTTAPTGFGFSLLATSLSAFSIGASDFFDFFQPIEGFNFADLAFGTAGAKTITISLWINASIAGTYGGYLINAAGNRTCVFSYSVPVANTWTYVTATVPGDTSGSWVGATNGIGIYVVPVSLGAGSSVTTSTTNTWGSTAFRGVTGQVNMVGTNGATVYITGFQLEVGVTATSFDYRPYSTELQLCQRYFQTVNSFTGIGVNTTTVNGLVTALSTMRTEPGVSLTGPYSLSDYFASDYLQSSASVSAVFGAVPMAVVIGLSNFTGITVGRTYLTRLNNANAITLSAEL